MEAGAMSIIAGKFESVEGSDAAATATRKAFPPARQRRRSPRRSFPLHISATSCFHASPKRKGWAMKALEFIDSGPPALLNNPHCCRRVVLFFPQTCNGGSLWLKRRKPRSRRL